MRHLFRHVRVALLSTIATVVLFAAAPSGAQASSLCLVPTSTTDCAPGAVAATLGIDIVLDVYASLDPGVSIGAFFLDLGWPSNTLALVSAVDGGFLGACGSVTPCFAASELTDEVFISFFDDTAAHAATGAGVLARLTFTPLTTGQVPLFFFGAGFDDEAGMPIFIDDNGEPTLAGQGLTLAVTSSTAPVPVPEPATLLLLGSGLAGALRYRRGSKVAVRR